MKFTPLDDQVLLRRHGAETEQGKLAIPTRAQEKSLIGEVLAVGPGRRLDDDHRLPVQLKPGDQVLFRKYAGDDVKFDGLDCVVIREPDVLGVIENQPEIIRAASRIGKTVATREQVDEVINWMKAQPAATTWVVVADHYAKGAIRKELTGWPTVRVLNAEAGPMEFMGSHPPDKVFLLCVLPPQVEEELRLRGFWPPNETADGGPWPADQPDSPVIDPDAVDFSRATIRELI